MSKHARKSCPQCRRLQAEIKALRAEMVELREQLASALKNSSTSSKPPSSDIVKPAPASDPDAAKDRTIGGQPGHARHEREPFPPEQVTHSEEHLLDACPCCGGRLRRNGNVAKVV